MMFKKWGKTKKVVAVLSLAVLLCFPLETSAEALYGVILVNGNAGLVANSNTARFTQICHTDMREGGILSSAYMIQATGIAYDDGIYAGQYSYSDYTDPLSISVEEIFYSADYHNTWRVDYMNYIYGSDIDTYEKTSYGLGGSRTDSN